MENRKTDNCIVKNILLLLFSNTAPGYTYRMAFRKNTIKYMIAMSFVSFSILGAIWNKYSSGIVLSDEKEILAAISYACILIVFLSLIKLAIQGIFLHYNLLFVDLVGFIISPVQDNFLS